MNPLCNRPTPSSRKTPKGEDRGCGEGILFHRDLYRNQTKHPRCLQGRGRPSPEGSVGRWFFLTPVSHHTARVASVRPEPTGRRFFNEQ